MSLVADRNDTALDAGLADVIKVAVLAVGGQGGGVLTSWIADLATQGGYNVQMTSVAGVAQRTGATVYYIEMAPKSERIPVFAQSPSPGDIDIMIAAELMEAGRAVMRGFVTPDRTTLIASTHRILAVSEKQLPGDGRSDSNAVIKEVSEAALNTVCFDMEQIAMDAGSVISSSLFGALAKSGALPFPTDMYEQVIRASGRGVEPSVAAFHAALNYESAGLVAEEPSTDHQESGVQGPDHLLTQWRTLMERVRSLEPAVQSMVAAGLRKVVDYQDIDYGTEYLDKVDEWLAIDLPEHRFELTNTAAKYVANAMCYDDIVRVADLKIRASREERIRGEQYMDDASLLRVTEYFHPRAEEICATLPAGMGAWFERSPRAFKLLDKVVNRGRRIRTDRLIGFTALWLITRLKPYRRKLYRHRQECAHLTRLLEIAREAKEKDYALAVEVLRCQRLVKGYSDTHARGQSKFDRVLSALALLQGQKDSAARVRELREIALQDESGTALNTMISELMPT